MVAILHQREDDVVLGKSCGQFDRVLPGHVGVLHALKDTDGTAGLDHAIEQKLASAILDQVARDRIGLLRILGRPVPDAFLLDFTLYFGREALPHQLLREIYRRRDQHQACHARARVLPACVFTREQQRQPGSHRGADHDLRTATKRIKHRQAVLQPAADRACEEISPRFAVS